MFWPGFTHKNVQAGTNARPMRRVDLFASNRPRRTLLAPSNLLRFSRLSTNSRSLEMEALGRSECVLMNTPPPASVQDRHLRRSYSLLLHFQDGLFLCVRNGTQPPQRAEVGQLFKESRWDQAGKEDNNGENRWADEEFDGSHSTCVSCRLNIFTNLVSVVPEILLKYKNILFFFSPLVWNAQ